MPTNRLAQMQQDVGVPLPAGTQWELMHAHAQELEPVWEEFLCQAANGDLFHNDDTTARILSLEKQIREAEASSTPSAKQRTGVFTTGIIAKRQERTFALFFSGGQHAGENLQALLDRRSPDLATPIQMCDGLSRNKPATAATNMANCNSHGRRGFVTVADAFPAECAHVLETMREVYKYDDQTRREAMSDQQRLLFHQQHSGPLMPARRTEQRPGRSDHLRAQTLGAPDPVPTQSGRPTGQQHLRKAVENVHPPPQQLAVLQNPQRCTRRRPVHEPDPHLPPGTRQPLRLPHCAAPPHPPRPRRSRCLDTMELPGNDRGAGRNLSRPALRPPRAGEKAITHTHRRDTFFRSAEFVVFDRFDLVERAMSGLVRVRRGPRRAALDLSAGGDEQVMGVREGNQVLPMHGFHLRDTDHLAQEFIRLFQKYELKPEDVIADADGVGAAIVDNIEGRGWRGIRRYQNNEKPRDPSRFVNRVAEDAFYLRRLVEQQALNLPADTELKDQMRRRRYVMKNDDSNKIRLEPKEKIRNRGEKSPDRLDVAVMLCAEIPPAAAADPLLMGGRLTGYVRDCWEERENGRESVWASSRFEE